MAAEAESRLTDADAVARLALVAVAAAIGVLTAMVFVGWPEFDLAVSRAFNLGPRHFVFNHALIPGALRGGFKLLTWVVGIAAVAGIILAVVKRRDLLGFGLKAWLFVALVLVLGPGLLANTLLKDNWPRPRPIHIVEFGGPDRFTPVLERTGQCKRNCSFISGEASSIFALGFAGAMLARRRRAAWMAAALCAGSLAGLIRIGEGGHFLSDVIFAGVFMALAVAFTHWLVFRLLAQRLRMMGGHAEVPKAAAVKPPKTSRPRTRKPRV